MNRLLIFLAVAMSLFSKAQAPKLGSEDDPIRKALFACQSMKEVLQSLKLDGTPGPFQSFADAVRLAEAGKKEEARSRLHDILNLPKLETRAQLWVWSALRELGEQPDPKSGTEVLGVVIEIPMEAGYDTLAAYQDGSARYLNFSGSVVFWDAPDATIQWLGRNFIDSAASASSKATPRKSLSLPKSGTQVTLLTRSGIYAISDPSPAVIRAASGLMVELIHRAKERKG